MKAITTSTDLPGHIRATASSSGDDVTQGANRRGDANPRRLRAIVADDDEPALHTVAAAVEMFGADVECVVTDVSMPWMTGLQVMHAARTAGLRTPVVVMTGLRDASVAAQASALGDAVVLVYRPFSVAEFYAAIRLALGRSGDQPIGANRERPA